MARNAYGGNCLHCGLWVEPGTGHFRRVRGGWKVHHANHPGHGRVTCAMVEGDARDKRDEQDAVNCAYSAIGEP